jgi:spermidine synthase
MVDIDEAVVRVSETYLQKWHRGAFSDPRVELIFADARAYLEKTEKKWDCIIVDVTDPILGGPSWSLFTKEFYQLAKTRVAQEGVFVQIVGMAETLSALNAVLRTLTTVFRFVTPYTINVGDFSGPWCFALASDHSHPRQLTGETVEAILKERGCFDLRAYGGRTHEAMFRPRSFGAIKLADGRIITDARPFFCD